MLYLLPDTPSQVAYMTLREGRDNLPSSYTDYLIELRHMESGAKSYSLLSVISENDKWTQVEIDTTGAELSGDYEYTVYAQNSPTNTNPNDNSVVGIVEKGLINLSSSVQFVVDPTITIPANVIR